MSNNGTQPFLINAEAAKALYKDLRDRINQIPSPVDPSVVIDDTSESATDKTWSAAKIVEERNKKAPIIIDFKSGNPIVIDDGIPGLKLYDMKVSFLPKQEGSGDPSPTNIRPITGWTGLNINRTGKNLYDGQFPNLSQYLYFRHYYVGNSTVTGSSNVPLSSQGYGNIFLLPGKADTGASTGMNNITDGVSRTVNPVDGWVTIAYRNNYDVNPEDYNVQIEIGTTATEFENFIGTTIPISWQSETGTVYGGELDVLTGVLTVTWIAVTKMFSEIKYNTGDSMKQGNLIIPEPVYVAGETGVQTKHICNLGIWKWAGLTETQPHFYTGHPDSNYKAYVIVPNEMDDNTPVTVASQLKEPRTVQLDPVTLSALIDTNTIWTDADTAEIAYPVNTKKYIDAGARDVQIAGTSILDDGVANIPMAGSNNPGVVKVGSWQYGIALMQNGTLYVSTADPTAIKQGNVGYRGVAPQYQHEAVFYGLSKVAGVDLASQTVTLGQYPSLALVAIQKMLGVYESPWELIREIITTQDETEIVINTDSYGESFELEKVICLFEAGPSTTGNRDSFYGQYKFINLTNGWSQSDSFPSIQYPTATSTIGAKIEFDSNEGIAPVSVRVISAVGDGNSQNLLSMAKKNIIKGIISIRIYQANSNTSLIPAGAKMTLYGKRVLT